MIDKMRELRRRRKRRYETQKLKRQTELLKAKKDTLRKLEDRGILPLWVKREKQI